MMLAVAPDGLPNSRLLLSPEAGGASSPRSTPRGGWGSLSLPACCSPGSPRMMPDSPLPLKTISSIFRRPPPVLIIRNRTFPVSATTNESSFSIYELVIISSLMSTKSCSEAATWIFQVASLSVPKIACLR